MNFAVLDDHDGAIALAVAVDQTRRRNGQTLDDLLEENIGPAEHAVAQDAVGIIEVDFHAHQPVVECFRFGGAVDLAVERPARERVECDGRRIADWQ